MSEKQRRSVPVPEPGNGCLTVIRDFFGSFKRNAAGLGEAVGDDLKSAKQDIQFLGYKGAKGAGDAADKVAQKIAEK